MTPDTFAKYVAKALMNLRPGAFWSVSGAYQYNDIDWTDEHQSKPTEQEIAQEIEVIQQQEPLDKCKAIAKELIAKSDWSALPDVGLANQSEFIAYRAALRALIINPVADPVFPTEPTPVWS